ncbi:hypothetical protein BC835DRAFT_1406517 [Cytidiella melzeri]|nr:hypothetical protein BC835DRAFT_1406517 [Cytidiella melzeri]
MTAIKAEGSFKPSPATPEEKSSVQQIVEVMCGACDEDKALTFLRRNGGNVDKTLSALLDNATDDAPTTSGTTDYSELRAAAAGVVAPHTPPGKAPVIDLTGDDDELSRALQASLQDQGPAFAPSERAPDPNWAVVPSNVAQDDQDLNQAIEASLTYEMNADPLDDRPLEDRIRQGDSPVALCPTQSSYIYASNIIYALYFIPQVRQYIASWRPSPETPAYESEESLDMSVGVLPPPNRGPHLVVWTLLETFVNMEFSRMNELCPDQALESCGTIPWNNPNRTPGELTSDFYTTLTWSVETVINADTATTWPEPSEWSRSDHNDHPEPPAHRSKHSRLFHLRHGKRDSPPYRGPFNKEFDIPTVRVTVNSRMEQSDLVSCLSADLVDADFKQSVNIVEAPEVLAFELLREPKPSAERQKFSYPSTVYLDQFLRENAAHSEERRRIRKAAQDEAERLQHAKASLLKHKGRDTLADLRSAVYYFETIADSNGDDIRRRGLTETAAKLSKIIGKIEEEVKRIDDIIHARTIQAAEALNCPELQKHKYDLRVVLVHDGLYGRNHLYSYVKYKGVWWKTFEYKVTEVRRFLCVLNDNVGFHLGAGPYFLIYSRSISEEEENARYPWPDYLKDTVKQNNRTFFDQLPHEISAGIVDPNSPPTSYATPLEEMSPVVTHAEEEPMDVDPHNLPA